ncbi:sugar phosphate nucleotidyltransferase [Azohydromonas caseinilytica]|uniref:NTP transferase domain-containing protein n=1 Tax=Azohydromonas caseinilytica TaxID=2728836 RepID=A0A848FIZ7_9BURK|nr:sugar phosphate nucleotidyltransferase [Azohydromonas caseinilytica]NML18213.1 NTP transferase domain-containing protein [Azohydromonas caseinilytica]
MVAQRIVAFILAGGEGTRLHPFTLALPKPALPLAGGWRVIDVVLSNLYNSKIRQIFVLLQYKPDILVAHLQRRWNIASLHAEDFVEPVVPGSGTTGRAFKGTAHAVYECLELLDASDPDLIAVFAADHLYRMDVRQMVSFHAAKRADATVASLPLALEHASEFGVVCTDCDSRILEFQEKPDRPVPMPGRPRCALVSMGNYLFKPEILYAALHAAVARGEYDFGRHVLPRLVKNHRVCAYDFTHNVVPGASPREQPGYWRDVGTVEAYRAAQHDLAGPLPCFDMDNPAWPMDWRRTRQEPEEPRMLQRARPAA